MLLARVIIELAFDLLGKQTAAEEEDEGALDEFVFAERKEQVLAHLK